MAAPFFKLFGIIQSPIKLKACGFFGGLFGIIIIPYKTERVHFFGGLMSTEAKVP